MANAAVWDVEDALTAVLLFLGPTAVCAVASVAGVFLRRASDLKLWAQLFPEYAHLLSRRSPSVSGLACLCAPVQAVRSGRPLTLCQVGRAPVAMVDLCGDLLALCGATSVVEVHELGGRGCPPKLLRRIENRRAGVAALSLLDDERHLVIADLDPGAPLEVFDVRAPLDRAEAPAAVAESGGGSGLSITWLARAPGSRLLGMRGVLNRSRAHPPAVWLLCVTGGRVELLASFTFDAPNLGCVLPTAAVWEPTGGSLRIAVAVAVPCGKTSVEKLSEALSSHGLPPERQPEIDMHSVGATSSHMSDEEESDEEAARVDGQQGREDPRSRVVFVRGSNPELDQLVERESSSALPATPVTSSPVHPTHSDESSDDDRPLPLDQLDMFEPAVAVALDLCGASHLLRPAWMARPLEHCRGAPMRCGASGSVFAVVSFARDGDAQSFHNGVALAEHCGLTGELLRMFELPQLVPQPLVCWQWIGPLLLVVEPVSWPGSVHLFSFERMEEMGDASIWEGFLLTSSFEDCNEVNQLKPDQLEAMRRARVDGPFPSPLSGLWRVSGRHEGEAYRYHLSIEHRGRRIRGGGHSMVLQGTAKHDKSTGSLHLRFCQKHDDGDYQSDCTACLPPPSGAGGRRELTGAWKDTTGKSGSFTAAKELGGLRASLGRSCTLHVVPEWASSGRRFAAILENRDGVTVFEWPEPFLLEA